MVKSRAKSDNRASAIVLELMTVVITTYAIVEGKRDRPEEGEGAIMVRRDKASAMH